MIKTVETGTETVKRKIFNRFMKKYRYNEI